MQKGVVFSYYNYESTVTLWLILVSNSTDIIHNNNTEEESKHWDENWAFHTWIGLLFGTTWPFGPSGPGSGQSCNLILDTKGTDTIAF